MFSSRLPPRLTANTFSQSLAALRAQGVVLADLTTTNPTRVGLSYPNDLLSSLAASRGRIYRPEPLGIPEARHAVASSITEATVDANRVVLTASTSEAYSLLFKLLCDPGDRVLVPEPSYPLFELLTRLDGVASATYRLEYHGVWSIDRDAVLDACDSRTKAILVVSPNNPTGSMLRRDDREWLVEVAADRGLALISDEVFGEYPLDPSPDATSLLNEHRVLTFTLGGLSKSAGLPQLKLGWIVVSGPDYRVSEALTRLEVICDTYLSVSTPVQEAAGALIAGSHVVRTQIQQRIAGNYSTVCRLVTDRPSIEVLRAEGGWSAVLRVPDRREEEALVLSLLRDHHIVVHPGFFFDFQTGAHVVVSLLPEPSTFEGAIARALEVVA